MAAKQTWEETSAKGRAGMLKKQEEQRQKKQAEIDAGLPVIKNNGVYVSPETQAQHRKDLLLQMSSIKDGTELQQYVFPRTRKRARPKSTKEFIKMLTDLSECTEAEARFWYDAVCACIFFELANERDLDLPGSGVLMPVKVKNSRHRMNDDSRKFAITPEYVRFKFRISVELKARLRLKYPFYKEEEYNEGIMNPRRGAAAKKFSVEERVLKIEDLC